MCGCASLCRRSKVLAEGRLYDFDFVNSLFALEAIAAYALQYSFGGERTELPTCQSVPAGPDHLRVS